MRHPFGSILGASGGVIFSADVTYTSQCQCLDIHEWMIFNPYRESPCVALMIYSPWKRRRVRWAGARATASMLNTRGLEIAKWGIMAGSSGRCPQRSKRLSLFLFPSLVQSGAPVRTEPHGPPEKALEPAPGGPGQPAVGLRARLGGRGAGGASSEVLAAEVALLPHEAGCAANVGGSNGSVSVQV